MQVELAKIYEKLVAHETEIMNLRKGYMVVNEKYTTALSSLRLLTVSAAEAAKRACVAAEKAFNATSKCAIAAKEAAGQLVIAAAAEAVKMSFEANAIVKKARTQAA